jgi:AraC family transcriptional regulator
MEKPSMKTMVAIVASLVFAFAGGVAIYVGAFKPVTISEEQLDAMSMLYVEHIGPYHKVVPSMEKVEAYAKSIGLKCIQTYGEYLDNPETIDQERLRAHVGCVLESDETLPETISEEFKVDSKDPRTYVVARFEGAPSIGPFKVYPKMNDWAKQNKREVMGSVIEIYTITGNQVSTRYLFKLISGSGHGSH